MAKVHSVVIIGTGFGGIYALKSIARHTRGKAVQITIIGRHNYFLFTPMLHEVATGVISHHQAAVAVRELLPRKSTQYMMAEVENIDNKNRVVHTDKGDVSYDTLLIATGAETNYFGIKGAEKHSFPVKTMMDAIRLRHRMTEQFETAVMEKDEAKRKELLTVVVVGGGPTGVEFAAEAAELIFDTFLQSSQGRLQKKDLRICLLNRGSSIIEMYSAKLQREALKTLRAKGVEICLEDEVTSVTEDTVHTKKGEVYKTRLVVWVAGVKPSIPAFVGEMPELNNGRLVVDETLRLPSDPVIYCIGDAAANVDSHGKALPMLAQVAVQQGNYVGKAIALRLENKIPKPFRVHIMGQLVSLGAWSAIAEVFGVGIKGPLASIFWKCIYLAKFVSFPKRFKILLDWFIGLFTRRDITIS